MSRDQEIAVSHEPENPVKDARDPAYNEDGSITAQVLFKGSEKWLPFTTAEWHTEDYGRQLFADLAAEKYGTVKPFTATLQSLDVARQQKYHEIDRWRAAEETRGGILQHDGRPWDYDKQTRERLHLALVNAQNLPQGFTWRDANNKEAEVTAENLQALAHAVDRIMFSVSTRVHQRQLQMKEEVAALSSLPEIRSYQTGWTKT